MNSITDTENVAITVIMRQAFDGSISTEEAVRRIRRAKQITAIERFGVQVDQDTNLDAEARRLGLNE